MSKAKAIRQGDVALWPAKIPAGAKRIPLRPIALGEVTGHSHTLVADDVELEQAVEMYECEGQTYLRVTQEGVSLVHQEHKAHTLAPIEYVYIPQVQNSDWGTQRVVD